MMCGKREMFTNFAAAKQQMVPVVQLVRESDCGSECRRFEPDRAPWKASKSQKPKVCIRQAFGF